MINNYFQRSAEEKKWIDIYASIQTGKILKGLVSSAEQFTTPKGSKIECCSVIYNGIKVWIPSSEMGISKEKLETINEHTGKTLERTILRSMVGAEIDFIVEGIDSQKAFAIGSRTKAMKKRKALEFHKLKEGDNILARVVAVGRSIVVTEVYGTECIVPKEEVDYGYINDLNEYVQVGDNKPAKIKSIDYEKEEVSISFKDAKHDPYENIDDRYEEGGEYFSTISGIKEFGIFVELEQGINALCPHPNWVNYIPDKGDNVLVKIKKIDKDKRKINASLIRLIRKNR